MKPSHYISLAFVGAYIYFCHNDMTKMIVATAVILLIGVAEILRHNSLNRRGAPATGKVTKITTSTGRHKYDDVFVTFTTKNGEQTTARFDETLGKYKLGDTLDITYLHDRPKKAYHRLPEKIQSIFYIYTIIGAGMAAWCIYNFM